MIVPFIWLSAMIAVLVVQEVLHRRQRRANREIADGLQACAAELRAEIDRFPRDIERACEDIARKRASAPIRTIVLSKGGDA